MKFPSKCIKTTSELEKYSDTIYRLMELHRSKSEIAEALLTSTTLLDEFALLNYELPFEKVLATFESRSNAELLEHQYAKAYDGKRDSRMLIYLGKNYAKQTEETILANVAADQIVFVDDITENDSSDI